MGRQQHLPLEYTLTSQLFSPRLQKYIISLEYGHNFHQHFFLLQIFKKDCKQMTELSILNEIFPLKIAKIAQFPGNENPKFHILSMHGSHDETKYKWNFCDHLVVVISMWSCMVRDTPLDMQALISWLKTDLFWAN